MSWIQYPIWLQLLRIELIYFIHPERVHVVYIYLYMTPEAWYARTLKDSSVQVPRKSLKCSWKYSTWCLFPIQSLCQIFEYKPLKTTDIWQKWFIWWMLQILNISWLWGHAGLRGKCRMVFIKVYSGKFFKKYLPINYWIVILIVGITIDKWVLRTSSILCTSDITELFIGFYRVNLKQKVSLTTEENLCILVKAM